MTEDKVEIKTIVEEHLSQKCIMRIKVGVYGPYVELSKLRGQGDKAKWENMSLSMRESLGISAVISLVAFKDVVTQEDAASPEAKKP